MKLIKWSLNNQKEQWFLYRYDGKEWQQISQLIIENRIYFFDILKSLYEPIDFAFIGLYLPYRNAICTAMPRTQIIIQPQAVCGFIKHFYQMPIQVLDEVAVSMDRQLKEDQQEVELFLTTFYEAQSLDEAKAIYDKWQIERSLWNELGNKLQLMMSIYEEEILNYFKYAYILPYFIEAIEEDRIH